MNKRPGAAVVALMLIPSLCSPVFALSYTDECENIKANDAAKYQGFTKEMPALGLGWAGCNDPIALRVKSTSATVTYKAGGAESMQVEILTDMPTYAVDAPKEGYIFGQYPIGDIKNITRCRYDKDSDEIFAYDRANDYVLRAEKGLPKFIRTDRQHSVESDFFGLNVEVSSGSTQFDGLGEITLTDVYASEDRSFYRETYTVKIPPGTTDIRLKLVFFNTLQGMDSADIEGLDQNILLSRVAISGDRLYMGYDSPPPESSKPDPEPSEPESSKPESSKPESSKPESSKPESSKPESSKPESSRPESSKPESSKPESSRPESSKPESSRPESSKPESSRPESSNPESSDSSPVPPPTQPVVPPDPPPVTPPVVTPPGAQPDSPNPTTPVYGGDVPVDDMGAGLINPYSMIKNRVGQGSPRASGIIDADGASGAPDAYSGGEGDESSPEGAGRPVATKSGTQRIGALDDQAESRRELLVGGGSVNAVALLYMGISLLVRRHG